MTNLLLINKGSLRAIGLALLLLVGCIDEYSPIEQGNVHGCLDSQACNYNSDANIDNNSCIYNDCLGECGGTALEDCAGICEGNTFASGIYFVRMSTNSFTASQKLMLVK